MGRLYGKSPYVLPKGTLGQLRIGIVHVIFWVHYKCVLMLRKTEVSPFVLNDDHVMYSNITHKGFYQISMTCMFLQICPFVHDFA